MDEETISKVHRKRPLLVWLISAVVVFSVIALNAYFLIHLFGKGSNATYAARLSELTAVDYVRRMIGSLLSLAAAVALFLLRKIAVLLFLVMLCLDTGLTVYSVSRGITPLSASTALLFPALVLWYAWRLKKRGLLV